MKPTLKFNHNNIYYMLASKEKELNLYTQSTSKEKLSIMISELKMGSKNQPNLKLIKILTIQMAH